MINFTRAFRAWSKIQDEKELARRDLILAHFEKLVAEKAELQVLY